MSLSEIQTRMKGRIWQAIGQSAVDVSAIPSPEMDQLVNLMTENVLREVNDLLEQVDSQPDSAASQAEEEEKERVLWEGRPFLSLGVHYTLTTERLRIVEGILGKKREDIELVRIQSLDQTQSAGERLLNIGDIHIRSHDPTSPHVILNNIANPQETHEMLRKAVLDARKRYKLGYREKMSMGDGEMDE